MSPIRRPAVALAAMAVLAPLGAHARDPFPLPEAKSCAECCKLPCIEAQLWEAQYRRAVYDRMSKIKNIDKATYERRQKDLEVTSSAMRSIYVGQNKSCNPWTPKNPEEAKQVGADYGIGTEWGLDEKGNQVVDRVNYTLQVDPETCKLNKPTGPDVMPKISTCSAMGEAVVAHEQKHMADCQKRLDAAKKSGKPVDPLTPAQNASSEVAGYDVEIARLEKARKESGVLCDKESCKESKLAFDRTARMLGTDIERIAGKGKKKPASNSPMQRAKKGS